MEFAKISADGQITIPKGVRKAASLVEGDVIAFEIRGVHLVMCKVCKVTPGQDDHLQGLSEVLSEWVSPEDEDAWRHL
ncbi:MAG: AbrB family transcriptional regulator [Acidobacteria bacterium]|nr:AbrB family transcriptional regulator [Acidobacteriota bacterium]